MMIKNKKGISPLIATVLIIGFTVALAALIITWGGGFIRQTQEGVGAETDIGLACSKMNFKIDAVDCYVAQLGACSNDPNMVCEADTGPNGCNFGVCQLNDLCECMNPNGCKVNRINCENTPCAGTCEGLGINLEKIKVTSNSEQGISGFILRATGDDGTLVDESHLNTVLGGFGGTTLAFDEVVTNPTRVEVIGQVQLPGQDAVPCEAGIKTVVISEGSAPSCVA